MITLLDTKNSGQPVFWEEEEEEEREEGKQTDMSSQLSGHSVQTQNVHLLPGQSRRVYPELLTSNILPLLQL